MKRLYCALFAIFLLNGCATSEEPTKTPHTRAGQLNSCMLDEAHVYRKNGQLADPSLDIWGLSRDILTICQRRLRINRSEINEIQSLNIISSTLKAMQQEATR